MTGDNKGSDVGKEASGAAGKLLDGLLGVTPLGTIAFGVNEILKRTGNGDKLGDLKKKVTDGAGKLAADAAKPAASAALEVQNRGTSFLDRFRGKNNVPESMKDTRSHDPNLEAKIAAGVYLGYDEGQDPKVIPVESRNPTPVEQTLAAAAASPAQVTVSAPAAAGLPSASATAPAAPAVAAAPAALAPTTVTATSPSSTVAYSGDIGALNSDDSTVAVSTGYSGGTVTAVSHGISGEKPFKPLTTKFNAEVYASAMKKLGLEGSKPLQEIKQGLESKTPINAFSLDR